MKVIPRKKDIAFISSEIELYMERRYISSFKVKDSKFLFLENCPVSFHNYAKLGLLPSECTLARKPYVENEPLFAMF